MNGGGSVMSKDFAAANSALGYLYQVRYALYLILRESFERNISIENLDDVAFETEGKPIELLQLKHKVSRAANLTDGSSDLWKTIRVWSELLKSGEIKLPGVILTLVTTGNVPNGSIASLLKDDQNRNPSEAIERLNQYIKYSDNKSNERSYEAFLSLTDEQKKQLISSIYIVDSSPDILKTEDLIKKKLLVATRKQYINSLYERLEGWWFKKVINHLINDSSSPILAEEVHIRINEITDQLRPDSLPIDFLHEEPEDILSYDQRRFVQQLKLLAISNNRIRKAIMDYYRAFCQRSKWIEENLIGFDELEAYERVLYEEWEEQFEIAKEGIESWEDEDELIKCGRSVYNWMVKDAEIPIRKNCTQLYVMRGSYHILADKEDGDLLLGWHPDFIQRLEKVLSK